MRSRGAAGAPGDAAPGVAGAGAEDASELGESVTDTTSASAGSASSGGGAAAPWWVGSSSPIVLRVPRGLAAAIVVGLLLLLVLAYFVGSVRGSAAAKANLDEQSTAAVAGTPGPRQAPPVAVSQEPEPVLTEDGGPAARVDHERRQPGQNYLRLQTGEKEECDRLAAFMADKGVAIQLYETRSGQFIVYAVDRGFRADELNTDACLAYKRKLMDLGRAWKRFNNNRGTDLGTLFFERFDG